MAALVRALILPFCDCRQAKAHYEGELKLRRMNNDHVGAMEWEWVWSMLQSKQGSSAGIAQEEVLAKAQQQVHMHSGLQSSGIFADFAESYVFQNRQIAIESGQHCCAVAL